MRSDHAIKRMEGLMRLAMFPGLIVGSLLSLSLSARAQEEFPAVEVFAGGAIAQIEAPGLLGRERGGGWALGFSGNFTERTGLAVEFGKMGPDGCPEGATCEGVSFPTPSTSVDFERPYFLAGPRFSWRRRGVRLFTHLLAGAASTTVERTEPDEDGDPVCIVIACFPPPPITTRTESGPGLAMAYGAGIDINLNSVLALRLIQLDYMPVRVGGGWDHSVRYQFGFTLRLGKRKTRLGRERK